MKAKNCNQEMQINLTKGNFLPFYQRFSHVSVHQDHLEHRFKQIPRHQLQSSGLSPSGVGPNFV